MINDHDKRRLVRHKADILKFIDSLRLTIVFSNIGGFVMLGMSFLYRKTGAAHSMIYFAVIYFIFASMVNWKKSTCEKSIKILEEWEAKFKKLDELKGED